MRHFYIFIALSFVAGAAAPAASAADTPAAAVVYLSSDDSVPEGREYREGDEVTTTSGMMVKLANGGDLELDRNTTIRLTRVSTVAGRTTTELKLTRGAIRSRVSTLSSGSSFKVVTPIATAGVRGTDFSVTYDPIAATATAPGTENSEVDVFEGTVGVSQDGSEVSLNANEGATLSGRQLRRRALAEKIRERWNERREAVIEKLRQRLGAGPDDDLGELLRERLKKMSPEQREAVKERLRTLQQEIKARAQAARARAEENAAQRRAAERRRNAPPPGRARPRR